jgi:hypothetical protein
LNRVNVRVHQTHCCIIHGCKYGSDNCPVELGKIKQKYPCEECAIYGIETVDEVKKYKNDKVSKCPHCGHILK